MPAKFAVPSAASSHPLPRLYAAARRWPIPVPLPVRSLASRVPVLAPPTRTAPTPLKPFTPGVKRVFPQSLLFTELLDRHPAPLLRGDPSRPLSGFPGSCVLIRHEITMPHNRGHGCRVCQPLTFESYFGGYAELLPQPGTKCTSSKNGMYAGVQKRASIHPRLPGESLLKASILTQQFSPCRKNLIVPFQSHVVCFKIQH